MRLCRSVTNTGSGDPESAARRGRASPGTGEGGLMGVGRPFERMVALPATRGHGAWANALSLRELDLPGLELLDDVLQGVNELGLLDPRFRERKGELVRSALRLVDERETARPSGVRLLFLLPGAEVVPGRTGRGALDRVPHLLRVLESGDLQEHRLRVDVGAPTFVPQLLRDVEERHRLGHRDPGLPDRVGDLLLGVAVALGETREAFGLLERVKVSAVEVLDQRDLEDLRFGDVELDAGDLGQPGLHGSAEASLPRDDPEA